MFHRPVSIACFISLAVCGGSSTTFSTDPIATSGFATANKRVQGGDSFEAQEVTRFIGSEDGELSFATQPVTYVISDDASAVTVTVDGTTFTLPFSESNGSYQIRDDDGLVAARLFGAGKPEVEIVDVTAIRNNTLNDGKIAIGFDTNPATVAAQTGNATFGGNIIVDVRNGFDDGKGEGLITLQVNFDVNTVGGIFNVIDAGDVSSELEVPSSSFTLETAEIDENNFTGAITMLRGEVPGTLENATYTGRFFGNEAQSVGGEISAIVTDPIFESPTFIQGAFVASQ